MNKLKTWDELIKNAKDNYGKNSSLAEFWKKAKEEALKRKGRSFREIYYDRPLAFHKDDK
jgi:hypothetical protein